MPEHGDYTARARGLVDAYLRDVGEAARRHKPGEGAFGQRGGVRDDPCHDRFARAAEELVGEIVQAPPEAAGLRDFCEFFLFDANKGVASVSAAWMLIAVHGLIGPLVGLLEPADAAALAARYDGAWPRRERFPAQQELLEALSARGGLPARKGRRRLFPKARRP